MKIRMCDLLRILTLAGKKVEGDDDSIIKKHLLFCNHSPDFEGFSVLTTNSNAFKVTLIKSLLINKGYPPSNKDKQSLPL